MSERVSPLDFGNFCLLSQLRHLLYDLPSYYKASVTLLISTAYLLLKTQNLGADVMLHTNLQGLGFSAGKKRRMPRRERGLIPGPPQLRHTISDSAAVAPLA